LNMWKERLDILSEPKVNYAVGLGYGECGFWIHKNSYVLLNIPGRLHDSL